MSMPRLGSCRVADAPFVGSATSRGFPVWCDTVVGPEFFVALAAPLVFLAVSAGTLEVALALAVVCVPSSQSAAQGRKSKASDAAMDLPQTILLMRFTFIEDLLFGHCAPFTLLSLCH